MAPGHAGLGSISTTHYNKSKGKERWDLVQKEVRAGVEEQHASQLMGLRQQGARTRWEEAMDRKISWSKLWRAEPYRIKFLIWSVYDVLPSPTNLFCWGKVEMPACLLCQGRETWEHILSTCPKALGDGCYCWRHDHVLKVVTESICNAIDQSKRSQPLRRRITFIRAREHTTSQPKAQRGLQGTVNDWQMRVDLGKQLRFPKNITDTSLRTDTVLLSETSKQVVMLELTVSWEEWMVAASERKREKYAESKTKREKLQENGNCQCISAKLESRGK